MSAPRLPKLVEADPRGATLLADLMRHAVPLWSGSQLKIPVVTMTERLSSILQGAARAEHIVRGLEGAERALAAEERGQKIADQKAGSARGARISRLLILSNDGAERFYRNVEALLRHHGDRVLALRVELDASTLGAAVLGPKGQARLLMVEHKDAVAAVLLAAVDPAHAG